MEVIKANPESINEIFQKLYVIPEYQRPYSWNEDKCHDLWDDIIEKYEEEENKKSETKGEYFLGTMVLIKNSNNKFEVIDGQQRLTSLLILLKALYDNHQFQGIKEIIYVFDNLTKKINDKECRINSKVLDNDKSDLKDIISNDGKNLDDKNKFKINYNIFKNKINSWKNNNHANSLENFIRFLLSNVKMLPIDCGEEENALKIFETLNDRGTPLSDADIFKSRIYNSIEKNEEKNNFIEFWKDITEPELYFRIYMHILRAKEKESGNEINIRKFFSKRIDRNSVNDIIKDLKKILLIKNYEHEKINKYLSLMRAYPVDIIETVYYVFMYKYVIIKNDEVELKIEDLNTLYDILENLIRFVYIKGIIYKTRNAIKYDIYKAYISIFHKKKSDFPNLKKEKKSFLDSLQNLTNRDKYTKSILFLYHNLNENQKMISITDYDKFQIEHILPKVYLNYDGWTKKEYEEI